LVSDSSRAEEPRVLRVQKASIEQNQVVIDPPDSVPSTHIAGCGTAPSTEQIVIVDPESCTSRPPLTVGEIWVSGGNVARGYWKNPEETNDTFRAFLKDSAEGPFLRTGDLGFLDNGELFVTGRLKDLIIVRGRNHYPEDIELTVERCHKGMRRGCTAAFSIQGDGDERLIIVQEIRNSEQQDLDDIIDTIHAAVLREHNVIAESIVLVRERTIPKTSSGKLQRSSCQAAYLAGSLDVLKQMASPSDRGERRRTPPFLAPRTPAENKLAEIWSEVLRIECIGVHDRFFDLGGDSLAATICSTRIAEEFGLEQFPAEIFLTAPTLSEMANAVSDPAKASERMREALTSPSKASGVPMVLVFAGAEFRNLVRRLGSDRCVLGVRSNGLDNLPAPRTIEQIASECVVRLKRHVPWGPYALGGWCAAGIVALEMARQLEAEGEQVRFVALLDARDILLRPMNQPHRTLVRSWRFVQRVAFFAAKVRRRGVRLLWRRAEAWRREVRADDSTDLLIPALRRYRPKPWSGRTIHLWAAERPKGVFRNPEFIWGHLSRVDLYSARCPAITSPSSMNRMSRRSLRFLPPSLSGRNLSPRLGIPGRFLIRTREISTVWGRKIKPIPVGRIRSRNNHRGSISSRAEY